MNIVHENRAKACTIHFKVVRKNQILRCALRASLQNDGLEQDFFEEQAERRKRAGSYLEDNDQALEEVRRSYSEKDKQGLRSYFCAGQGRTRVRRRELTFVSDRANEGPDAEDAQKERASKG